MTKGCGGMDFIWAVVYVYLMQRIGQLAGAAGGEGAGYSGASGIGGEHGGRARWEAGGYDDGVHTDGGVGDGDSAGGFGSGVAGLPDAGGRRCRRIKMDEFISHECGLIGVSESSSDMRGFGGSPCDG